MTQDQINQLRAELSRTYRERDAALASHAKVQALCLATIKAVEAERDAAIAEAGVMLAVLKAAVAACVTDEQETYDGRDVKGWCSDCGGENWQHRPGCWVGECKRTGYRLNATEVATQALREFIAARLQRGSAPK